MTKKSFIKTIGSKGLLSDYNTEGKKLQTELTFDTTPTAGSNNPVTSGGIYKSMYSLSNPATPSSFTKDGESYSFVCRTNVKVWTRSAFEGYAFPVDWQTFDMIRIRSIVYSNPPTDSAIVSITCGKQVYEKFKFVQAIYNNYCYIFANNPFRPLYISPNKYINSDMNSSSMTQDIFQTLTLTKIEPSIDDVTFDTTPTAGSNNPVTSDGIKKAISNSVDQTYSSTSTKAQSGVAVNEAFKTLARVYGENLFNVTMSGGFYVDSGIQTANADFDSCQLVLKPGTTYKVINQITDNGNNIRLFEKSGTGYTQLKVWNQIKDPLIFTSPFDSTKEYMLQVVRDLRFANYPEIYEYNFAGEVIDVAKLANRKRKIKILAIGNSYSRDNYSYVPKLMENLADVDVTFGILYKGSCTLKQHFNIWNVNGDYQAYDKYTTSAGRWTTTNTYNCVTALNEEDWDIITLQQQSSDSRDYNTFQPYLNDLHNLLLQKSSHNFKLAWLMTMAYPTGYSGLGSDTSDGMFAKIVSAAQAAMNGSCLEFLIPCGTATQNARHTSLDSLGDFGHLSYDGLHLQEGLPCLISNYVAALVFLEKMGFGYKGINANNIRPTQRWIIHLNIPEQNGYSVGVSNSNCQLAQKCALYAMKKPFEITEGIV